MSSAREAYRDGSQALATTDTTVATMTNVVAGAYAISAKTIVDTPTSGSDFTAVCTLDAGGGDTDTASYDFTPGVVSVDLSHEATLALHVNHVFAATGSIVLRCRSSDASVARNTKIVALKVDTVTREAVTG
ncbi:MAG TPA: hypothetical protein VNP89_03210 [Gaiellaceae bacterium]|nr:hypothetical protein [Gaiellaceae bacterium]